MSIALPSHVGSIVSAQGAAINRFQMVRAHNILEPEFQYLLEQMR
jgi:hypothetical protein